MIRTQSADGVTHEFPDGTAPEAVDKAMKTYADERQNKTTTLQQVGRGIMDPVYGAAQMGARMEEDMAPLASVINEQFQPGSMKEEDAAKAARIKQVDDIVKGRETQIQQERGGTKDIDWARMGGNVISPMNFVGPQAALPGAGWAVNTGRAILGGIMGGLSQPVLDTDNFGKEKVKDVAIGGTVGAVIGGAFSTAGAAVRQLGSFLAREHPENIDSDAVRAILRRISQDEKAGGPSATSMIDLVNAAEKPIALADVGKGNVTGLAGRVARQPGESKAIAEQFLLPRDEGAAQRLSEDVKKYVSGGPSMFKSAEALLQARSATSKPLYEDTFKLQNVWSPRLEEFLQEPLIKQGLTKGYELERLHSLATGSPLTATQLGVDIAVDGSIKMLAKPNMRLLDMAKQGIDAMIAEERNEITGRLSKRGVALEQVRRAYVEELDKLDTSGVYKRARSQWAGYSQSLDAIRMGRSVFAGSPEENAAAIEKMVPAVREFYRIGVADRLREQLSRAGFHGDEAKQILKNSWMREQLRPAFRSSEEFDKFVEAVTTERNMFETTRKVLGGSQTAERVAEDGTPDPVLAGAKFMFKAKGNPFGAIRDAWQLWQDVGMKPSPQLNARIAEILFSPKLDAADKVVESLRSGKIPEKINVLKALSSGIENAGVATGAGAGAGLDFAAREDDRGPTRKKAAATKVENE